MRIKLARFGRMVVMDIVELSAQICLFVCYPLVRLDRIQVEPGEGDQYGDYRLTKKKEIQLTITRMLKIIRPISIRDNILPKPDPRSKLRP